MAEKKKDKKWIKKAIKNPGAFTAKAKKKGITTCLLYTSPSPRDRQKSRMPSSA